MCWERAGQARRALQREPSPRAALRSPCAGSSSNQSQRLPRSARSSSPQACWSLIVSSPLKQALRASGGSSIARGRDGKACRAPCVSELVHGPETSTHAPLQHWVQGPGARQTLAGFQERVPRSGGGPPAASTARQRAAAQRPPPRKDASQLPPADCSSHMAAQPHPSPWERSCA